MVRRGLQALAACLTVLVALCGSTAQAQEAIRLAFLHAELTRKGPGLLLLDLLDGDDQQIFGLAALTAHVAPDILVLAGVDHDLDGHAARLLAQQLGFAHAFAPQPNTGVPTGLDLDRDGRLGGRDDAQSFADFRGQGGMVILSRWPIDQDNMRSLSGMLWAEVPDSQMPVAFYPDGAAQVLRLSSVGHWDVPIQTPDGPFHVLAFHAQSPVFDGAEDRNGKRNHDEIALWRAYLDGAFGPSPQGAFAIMGVANADPDRGEGARGAIAALLADPRLTDPRPIGSQGTRTVDWSADGGPGKMRVDYIMPSAELQVIASGVVWPEAGTTEAALLGKDGFGVSRHRMVWVDVLRD